MKKKKKLKKEFEGKSCFERLGYISDIIEPDFGCEGRNGNDEAFIEIVCMTTEGKKVIKLSEKMCDDNGIEADLWIGMLKNPMGEKQMALRGKIADEYSSIGEDMEKIVKKVLL